MGVSALTRSILLHYLYDLEAVQMCVLCRLFEELLFYDFEPCHNSAVATKKQLSEMWIPSWSRSNNQTVQEIWTGLKEAQQLGMAR